MRKTGWILLFSVATTIAFAQEKSKKITMEVDGVCEMCKTRIEKTALGEKGVKYATWDISSHQLSLIIDERKTNPMKVKMALANAGHDTKELKATDEAYSSVHFCCRYRDENMDNGEEH